MIFDPGITRRSCDELSVVREIFNVRLKGQPASPVVISGCVVVKGKVFKLDRVLFDSGALSSSYINQGLVDKFRDMWSSNIYEVDGEVKLADQTTTLRIKEEQDLS